MKGSRVDMQGKRKGRVRDIGQEGYFSFVGVHSQSRIVVGEPVWREGRVRDIGEEG